MEVADATEASKPSRIMIVDYGTLLYRASLGNTIGKSAADEREMVPVMVRGFRRLFYLRPDHYGTNNLCGKEGAENAAMNVEPVEGAVLNGLAFRVEPAEIPKLDERERYYHRTDSDGDFIFSI
jgi:cation transport regulator ChaC